MEWNKYSFSEGDCAQNKQGCLIIYIFIHTVLDKFTSMKPKKKAHLHENLLVEMWLEPNLKFKMYELSAKIHNANNIVGSGNNRFAIKWNNIQFFIEKLDYKVATVHNSRNVKSSC